MLKRWRDLDDTWCFYVLPGIYVGMSGWAGLTRRADSSFLRSVRLAKAAVRMTINFLLSQDGNVAGGMDMLQCASSRFGVTPDAYT